ncbi:MULTISPECIES: hypothetical protein [unclassified Pseudoalteromonas]|uniref:hypothetical protein n=1 Tax=unclassified Pseudoalteromonas TaxID=194690 RepID=UPI001601F321|nr:MULTISPECIES: hypothetical protein [unclassified Pseudoalteromonas]MBB1335760.1 hypothetical protein [Pseudoalteromonas sp. SR41-6]MBB1461343.1 hypothetical protein [Pseudoalteromonas sp. SG41-8]
MNTCKVNDENFKLEITDKGLKNLLLNSGSEKVIAYVSSLYEEKFTQFQRLNSTNDKLKKGDAFFELVDFGILHREIFDDLKCYRFSSEREVKKIKLWESLLLDMKLSEQKKLEITTCVSLWVDENAEVDLEQLKKVCYSLKLISTCFLCQNGQFLGDDDYSNNEFVNCLADIPIGTEVYKKCTAFEIRVSDNE